MFGIPLRIFGVIAVAALIAYCAFVVQGWRRDSLQLDSVTKSLSNYQRAYTAAQEKLAIIVKADDAKLSDLRAQLAKAQADGAALAASFDHAPLIKEVVHEGACPTDRLSDAFGVCVSAILSGADPAAASCAANGGDGGKQPGHRVQLDSRAVEH